MEKGTVKNIISDRGFGFVTDQKTGDDIFFHIKTLGAPLFNSLKKGQRVEYETEKTNKGIAVKSLKKVQSEPAQELFIPPTTFIRNKASEPKHGRVVFRTQVKSGWARDPADAEEDAIVAIKNVGGNALLNMRMEQATRQSGNYKYREFRMAGDCALVMNYARSDGAHVLNRNQLDQRVERIRNNVAQRIESAGIMSGRQFSEGDELRPRTIIGAIIFIIVAFIFLTNIT